MNIDTGVYKISSPSGNFYIGSATSFRKRWARHLSLLRRGEHHSKPLQAAFNKYDGELEFTVLARCPITDLLVVEQAFIDSLNPKYNIDKIAGSRIGARHTAETRAKMSAARSGEKHHFFGKTVCADMRGRISKSLSGSKNPNFGKPLAPEAQERLLASVRKAVVCIETGVTYESAADAVRWLRQNVRATARTSHISSVCHGKLKQAYGYTWQFSSVS